MKKSGALIALVLLPAVFLVSQEPQIRTGTATGAAAVRLAVPEFQPRGTDDKHRFLTALFNDVLWADLEYSGVLTLVSRSFYPLGRFSGPGDITPELWTRQGVDAQMIAFGNAAVSSGRFTVEARLWDLQTRIEERQVIGERYGNVDTDEGVRLIAHQFADKIVELLGGGLRGVARTKIAFASERARGVKEIYVMDYDGHNQYPLTSHRLALTPSWAPDGEKIAFTSYQKGTPDIAIISRITLRDFPFEKFKGTNTTPVWSPDGARIAFSSSMNDYDMEIYTADWNGRNLRRVTVSRGNDISPSWNPRTGREIAFVSRRSSSPQIYIADVDGGNIQRIVEEGGETQNPSWSPDGQTIAFAWKKAGAGVFDVYLYTMATGKFVQLTANAGDNERPTWAPDGRRLAFESTRTGTTQVFSMLADGTKVRQLTRTGRNQGPAWSGYIGQ